MRISLTTTGALISWTVCKYNYHRTPEYLKERKYSKWLRCGSAEVRTFTNDISVYKYATSLHPGQSCSSTLNSLIHVFIGLLCVLVCGHIETGRGRTQTGSKELSPAPGKPRLVHCQMHLCITLGDVKLGCSFSALKTPLFSSKHCS